MESDTAPCARSAGSNADEEWRLCVKPPRGYSITDGGEMSLANVQKIEFRRVKLRTIGMAMVFWPTGRMF